LDTYRENVDLLVAMPNALKAAVDEADDPPEGEWSAAQVLAHLAAAEQLWLERLNLLLHQRDPLIKPPTKEYAELQDRLMAGDAEANLAEFNTRRGETISLMMGLSLNDWSRSGVHETLGVMSIEDVVEHVIEHDSEHLEQIRALARSS
jgi:uncharacterized damage-inducible protein DinB